MIAVLLAHAIAAAVAPLLVYRWGRQAFYPLAMVPLLSLVWVAMNWPTEPAQRVRIEWVPELSMDIDLRFDTLAAIMSVLVLSIGALVLFFLTFVGSVQAVSAWNLLIFSLLWLLPELLLTGLHTGV